MYLTRNEDDKSALISPDELPDLTLRITNSGESGVSIKSLKEKSNSIFFDKYVRLDFGNGGVNLPHIMTGLMKTLTEISQRQPFYLAIEARGFFIPGRRASPDEEVLIELARVYCVMKQKYLETQKSAS